MKIKRKQDSISRLVTNQAKRIKEGREADQVCTYLENAIRSLSPNFSHMYFEARNPTLDDGLTCTSPIFLEWNEQRSLIGMGPELVNEVLMRFPHLKPASQEIKKIEKAGYKPYGLRTSNPIRYAVRLPNYQLPLPKEIIQDLTWRNCYALTLPKEEKHLSSQKVYLIIAHMEKGDYDYEDALSYLGLVSDRLTKRFIDLGVPNAHASLQISNSPGLSIRKKTNFPRRFVDPKPPDELSEAISIRLTPEPILPRPPARMLSTEEAADVFNREASYKILLSYKEPGAFMQPTKKQVMDAISKMPELTPASKMTEELKQAGYDGWFEVGRYPDNVYALDITKMPNHITDDRYQKLILFNVYNSSQATVVNPDEEEIQVALNKAMADAGFSNVGIEISSEGGPRGPNYFRVVHSGYCPPEDRVRQALSSIPGISPNPTEPQPIGVPGYLASSGKFTVEKSAVLDPNKANQLGALGYMNFDRMFSPLGTEQKAMVNSVEVDLHQMPALVSLVNRLKIDKVRIYFAENVMDGY